MMKKRYLDEELANLYREVEALHKAFVMVKDELIRQGGGESNG